MSRTYRLIGYKNGKPIYSRNERQVPKYKFYTKEYKLVRKRLWRSYRHKCKIAIRKQKEISKWRNTRGWITW